MNVTRALRLIAVTAALALPVASGVSEARQQGTATSTGRSFATRATESDIRRFAEICPGLARGGEPSEADLQYLHDKGYKTVVSFLDNQAESVFVVKSGMKYVNIPMHSNMFSAQPPTESQVRQFLSIVKDSTQAPVFIHCHAGKDRTGAMSAIYRMEVCGWTKDEAIEEMRAFGFAGHFKRLYNYVRDYSPHVVAASMTADSKAAEATLPADAKLPADNKAP
jgi:protein tyrosine phosphatase (PTP) superfamily phosphohydrolase (DUF442 family)